MLITYGSSKISCKIIHCIHAPVLFFQNALAYFVTTVTYGHLLQDFVLNIIVKLSFFKMH
jgi:hypothetical protein